MTQSCPYCRQEINLSLIVEEAVIVGAQDVADIKYVVQCKVGATDREIYNALSFLARHGRIERVGYGKYRRHAIGETTDAKGDDT